MPYNIYVYLCTNIVKFPAISSTFYFFCNCTVCHMKALSKSKITGEVTYCLAS